MSADGGNPQQAAAEPAAPARKRFNGRRIAIMAAVPVVLLIVGGYFWLSGGRYVGTDNAYVQQDRVTINTDISGRIIEVDAKENQAVAAGDLLFRIDPEPFRIALEGADAALASARIQVEQMRAAYQQAVAENDAATENADYKRKAFQRQQDLLAKGVTSQAAFDSAENELRSAEQTLRQSGEHVSAARAALGGDPTIVTEKHPAVLAAQAKRDQAALDLKNTEVRAPSPGLVSQTDRMQVGQYVTPSTAVMALVATSQTWIEANFKETDLARMRAGQPAEIEIDAYPGKLHGVVDSIGAGTGAEFALLPAQNATGNWVKVVQRVPVRIRIESPPDGVLRTGLSAYVSVDTQGGAGTAAAATAE